MPSRTRIPSLIKFAAAVAVTVSALIVGASFETPARAVGTGPTLTLSGPGVLPGGGAFDLVFKSSGAVADPYAGFDLAFTYDPALVSFPSVTNNSVPAIWPMGFCPTAASNLDLGPILTPPPLKAYVYGCLALGAGSSSVGTLATVHAQALDTGTITLHMLTVGPPDNSSPFGTFTIDDADREQAQSNTLACSGSCSGADVTVIVPAAGSISGKVYHDSVAPANAVAGVVINACMTGPPGTCFGGYTDSTGAYKVRFLDDGTYNVTALPSNPFAGATIGPVTVAGAVDTPGQNIVMPTPAGAISGTVYLNTFGVGNELAGATVGACPTVGGECRTAVSTGVGAYTIPYLVDGSYDVTAVASGINFQQSIGPIIVSGGVVSGQNIVVIPPTGGISGHVYHDSASPANALVGAQVSACPTSGPAPCRFATTDGVGAYIVNFLGNGNHTVSVFAPGDFTSSVLTPVVVAGGAVTAGQDLVVTAPVPPPPTDSISPVVVPGGVPTVNWSTALSLTKTGCSGGTASYQAIANGGVVSSGPMAESPTGTYTAYIPALAPNHGTASIAISLDCGSGPVVNIWNIWIDPSGYVKTQAGVPIVGATVTLLRSDSPFGPFNVVPNGSDIMSPMNRVNPDKTDATGHFGWDVTAGYYRVRASKPGCISAADPGVQVLTWRVFATTGVLEIPPPVFDIDLRLICDDVDQDGYTNKVEIVRGDHPTIYCQTMRSDIDDDGVVSILDFSKAAAFFGQSTSTTAPPRYDQGPPPFDGSISILDFSKMASVFQKAVNDCP